MPARESPEIPDKLFFRIGEVARITGVKAYVLRFWESEFGTLRPEKGRTGQRRYRRSDIDQVLRIKDLLWTRKFTIPGARKELHRPAQERGTAEEGAGAAIPQGWATGTAEPAPGDARTADVCGEPEAEPHPALERAALAERVAEEALARLREAEERAGAAELRGSEFLAMLRDAEDRAARAEHHGVELETLLRDAGDRILLAERRGEELETLLRDAEDRLASAAVGSDEAGFEVLGALPGPDGEETHGDAELPGSMGPAAAAALVDAGLTRRIDELEEQLREAEARAAVAGQRAADAGRRAAEGEQQIELGSARLLRHERRVRELLDLVDRQRRDLAAVRESLVHLRASVAGFSVESI